MLAREFRVLLAPEEIGDPVDFPVSRSTLANLVREKPALAEEVEKLREENRRLREEKARSRAKNAALKSAVDRLRTSLSVLGTDAKTAAAVGVPSSKVFFRQPPPPPDRPRSSGAQTGHPGTTRPRATPNHPPKRLALTEFPKRTPPSAHRATNGVVRSPTSLSPVSISSTS